MATDAPPLDTSIQIVTPENIAFHYHLAGPFPRLLAFLIDALTIAAFVILMMLALVLLFPLFGVAGFGFYFLAVFIIFWGYGGILETFWNGQTLGKRALNLRVVSTSGLPINAAQAMLRNILRFVDLLFYATLGGASMSLTRRFQRLGDLAAQTMVVREHRHKLVPLRVASGQVDALDEAIPLAFDADTRLAEALGGYVARRGDLSPERRTELAYILAEPLLRRWNLPRHTDPDLLLCALYQRAFFGGPVHRKTQPTFFRPPDEQTEKPPTESSSTSTAARTTNPFESTASHNPTTVAEAKRP